MLTTINQPLAANVELPCGKLAYLRFMSVADTVLEERLRTNGNTLSV